MPALRRQIVHSPGLSRSGPPKGGTTNMTRQRFLPFVSMGCLLATLLALPLTGRGAGTRVKDLVMVAGARDNQLVGFGLVAGLVRDGDKNPVYTVQSIANMLQRFGITVPAS